MSNPLPALTRAITLTTRLRSIAEKKINAEFKAALDDILLELAEVQLQLEGLVTDQAARQAQSHPQGQLCPRCGELGWRLTSSRPHGQNGAIVHTYGCRKCGLKEEVLQK